MNEPVTVPPYFLDEAAAFPIMRRALQLHAHLLPPWQKPNESTATFGAVMLANGAVGELLFCLGREFATALVPTLEQADAFELVRGLREAIRFGPCLTDEKGIPFFYPDYMALDTPE